MREKIFEFLYSHKRKMVDLATLQDHLSGGLDYSTFAAAVKQLEAEEVLIPVKANGLNNRSPALSCRYRLGQAAINRDFFDLLKRYRLRLYPLIQLDHYYRAGEKRWEQDLPWLEKLDLYLKTMGLPRDKVPGPERSYQIFGDEKWMDEAGGREFLARVGVGEEMLGIITAPEPLMWGLQQHICHNQGRTEHSHLIVENKTPFYVLLPLLQQQDKFTTLIYGRGKTIVSSMQLFISQTGLSPGQKHIFYYFGDLDHEGISIWHSLRNKIKEIIANPSRRSGNSEADQILCTCAEVLPARPFYRALLARPHTYGKENQKPHPEALARFLEFFSVTEQGKIKDILSSGGYLPQEALGSEQLKELWINYSCGNRNND